MFLCTARSTAEHVVHLGHDVQFHSMMSSGASGVLCSEFAEGGSTMVCFEVLAAVFVCALYLLVSPCNSSNCAKGSQ